MNIVVLDGYCLNPGDLSWEALNGLGEATLHDRTPEERVIERAIEAEILLTNKTPVTREAIEKMPKLKYIGLLATGYNVVDIEAAAERKIVVTNVPTYGTDSVAQMVFAHILNWTQHVADHAQTVRDGKWCESLDFCYWEHDLVELSGLTLGLIGFGRIGQATARIGVAMGMKVLAFDTVTPAPVPEGVEMTTRERIIVESDMLSLHCPLTPKTEGMINKATLAMMKRTALLINTSRGPLVDERALADALNQGLIAGACLDVLTVEPPLPDNPLLKAKNCIITPHIAWANKAARMRLMDVVIENIRAFLDGKPQNEVTG